MDFILRNTQGAAAPAPANLDPFTASGAYVPGGAAPAGGGGWGASTSGSADPFTGARAVPQPVRGSGEGRAKRI